MAESDKRLSDNDWEAIAQWLRAEYMLRCEHRRDREKICKEIDRQLALNPRARAPQDGTPGWYPDIEMPMQFNALEVICADQMRLLFPRTGTWYRASANLTDEYINEWNERRMMNPLIGSDPSPIMMDQDTGDALVRGVIDHFHKMYDFRQNMGICAAEAIKYGTGISRVLPVKPQFYMDNFRGGHRREMTGPAVIPCSFWNTYLDDSWNATMHEGTMIGPSTIRTYWQPLGDLERTAKVGGADKGWIASQVKRLIGKVGPDERKGQVQLLEFEGDILVPKSQGSIYLPNVRVWLAMHQGNVNIVRFQKSPVPFRTYVNWTYFRHDPRSPYGDSPLIKGEPLQEMITAVANDLLATTRMNALPPIAYDRHDPTLAAAGGPVLHPNAMMGVDAPNAVQVLDVGDPVALFNALSGLIKQHEDTTQQSDGRRGQRLKSHTTAYAADVEAAQGIARTDDFVTDLEMGPVTTILYMEYAIARDSLTSPQPIAINSEGIDGWIKLAGADLPPNAEFQVVGAEGASSDRERSQAAIGAHQFAISLATAAAQLGVPMTPNFEAMARDVYERSGINKSSDFIGAEQAVVEGAAAESAVPGLAGGMEAGLEGGSGEVQPMGEGPPPGMAIQ